MPIKCNEVDKACKENELRGPQKLKLDYAYRKVETAARTQVEAACAPQTWSYIYRLDSYWVLDIGIWAKVAKKGAQSSQSHSSLTCGDSTYEGWRLGEVP